MQDYGTHFAHVSQGSDYAGPSDLYYTIYHDGLSTQVKRPLLQSRMEESESRVHMHL